MRLLFHRPSHAPAIFMLPSSRLGFNTDVCTLLIWQLALLTNNCLAMLQACSFILQSLHDLSLSLCPLISGCSIRNMNNAVCLQACRPLLQALHDLAVCLAAGLAAGCKEGMCALQQQLQQESVDGDTLPAEGRRHS